MSKIRINELARELEVKPSVILDILPEVGVHERKTHSSSLEDDTAERVREALAGMERPGADSEAGLEAPESHAPEPPTLAATKEEQLTLTFETATAPEPSLPAPPVPPESPGVSAKPPAPVMPPPAAPPPVSTVPEAAAVEEPPRAARRAIAPPLRPPLAGRGRVPSIPVPPSIPQPPKPSAPPAPIHPPLARFNRPLRPAAPAPPPVAPPVPGAPSAPPPPPPVREPAPAAARPGQILSGPRQPLPPDIQRSQPPGMPAARPAPPLRPAPPAAVTAPGSPSRPIIGQPPPRPVVPPRPDLVARLQGQARTGPGQPSAPRPGAPAPQRPGSPIPGQPIYRGPVRPGMPAMRGPGMPGGGPGGPGGHPGGAAMRPRGRGMHPTSPLQPEVQPAPTDPRRHAQKPSSHKPRDREAEREGKLRPMGRPKEEPVYAVNKEITIGEGLTVKELAEKLGIKASLVIKKLVDRKIFATINQTLDLKLAEDLVKIFGASSSQMTFEEESTWEVEMAEDTADFSPRAPVVTVMGHVDHGKTSLLDAIRSTEVAAREAGGITQHIGAYQIVHNGRKIVFIDTPGHEAFTRMRARGAKVTDIVILVVAADDGVMPQTLEAIDHAKAAGVPILVAINKIDKPDANLDRIKQQLNDRGLLAEDWGGSVPMIPCSAKTGQNLELLLEYIGLVTDMQNLRANPSRPAVCTVLEAKLDRGRGPVATVLVRNGTLRVGDYFICGTVFSRVRALVDDHGENVQDAEPATPVEVLGLEALPDVGDTLQVVTDTAKAKQIVGFREHKAREVALSKTNRLTLETLHAQLREGETKELNLIIKADVGGSAEVLSEALQKLSTDKVRIKVLHTGVGAVTETDVLLASASDAIIIGFNVRPERTAAQVAEQENVEIRMHTIIYELASEIKKAMAGLLEPVIKETFRGRAQVKDAFRISKVGTVAGCLIVEGTVQKNNQLRILRDNVVVHTGKIEGLRRFKDEVSEVRAGVECGISVANFNDIKAGDIIETFTSEKIAAELN